MKGLTWKKIMSLVLVAALVIGCLQLNAKKVSANVEDTVNVIPGDQGRNPSGQYQLTGLDEISSTTTWNDTDVVLVVDLSTSMRGDRLTQVKAAATNFVSELLKNDQGKISIGIVSYGTEAKVVSGLTKNAATLNTAINGEVTDGCGGSSVTGGLTIDSNNGLTNIQDGIKKAEGLFKNADHEKVIVLLSDGEPTVATDANGRQVLNQHGYYCSYSEEIGQLTKKEADNAKNSGITIYSILFGETSDTAQKVMRDYVGSKDKYYLSSANSEAINSVYTTIAQSIQEEHVAGVKSAYIIANLANYIAFDEAATNNASIVPVKDENGKVIAIRWNIGELGNTTLPSPSIKFQVTATADQLIEAGYTTTTNAAGQTVIKVPVTAQTSLYYTTSKGEFGPYPVERFITADFIIGEDIVPYTVNYLLDGEANGAAVTGNAYVGDDIPVNTNYLQNDSKYTIVYPTDVTAKANSQNVLNVTATTNIAIVTFYDIDVDATEANEENKAVVEKLVKTIEVPYGDDITDTEAVALLRKTYEKRIASGSAITFTWNEQQPWKNAQGEVVSLGKASENVAFFANYGDTATSYKHVVFKDEDGTVFVDGYFKEGDHVIGFPMKPEKTYDENQYSKYEFAGWYDEKNNKGDFSDVYTVVDDVVYTATYDKVLKQYAVKYVYGETELEIVTVDYGTKVVDAVATKLENSDVTVKESAETKAVAAAKALTDAEDNNKDVYSFTGWDKTFTDETVKADVIIKALISATALKDYTVKYYYQMGNDVVYLEGKDQAVKAGDKLALITPDEVKDGYIFDNDWYEKSGVTVFGGMDIFQNLDIVFEYREIQKATFRFFTYEETVASNVPFNTISFDETNVDDVKAPAGPAKDKTATIEYTFKEWVTFVTYAEMEELVRDVITTDEKGLSPVYGPRAAAGTENEDGFWVSYEDYMNPENKLFSYRDKDFYPTYDEKEIKNTPTGDPVITLPLIIITETPEEPTPTVEPTPEPTAEPTPTAEPEIEIEETETPEGDVEIEETETPEGAPEEEELEVEPIDTPQGDLPQTGVTPSAVFFGIGAACVVFGGAIVLKLRRKEEM